jgi:glycosyltransferase involved in cell wall biosynthesis
MRVLHLYAGNLYGGVEKILATLAREGAGSGMDQQFALCFDGRLSEELRSLNVPVHILGAVRLSRPWTGWLARKRLLALVDSRGFDVVVAHGSWVWAIFGRRLQAASIPTALWIHGRLSADEPVDRLATRTKPDMIIAVSKDTAVTVKPMYPAIEPQVLYTPLPPMKIPSREDRERVRCEMGVGADQVVIAQVSRMEAGKGHRVHLEALGRLKDLPQWICWMIGGAQRPVEREYLDALKKLAADLGVAERVRFLGERRDVPMLLSAADIFCQPNTGPEGLGIVFLEALMNRVPAITTNIGGAPEVVDPTCGRLVAVGDAEGLAVQLRELIENASLRVQLGAAGPHRARVLCEPREQLRKLQEMLGAVALATNAAECT